MDTTQPTSRGMPPGAQLVLWLHKQSSARPRQDKNSASAGALLGILRFIGFFKSRDLFCMSVSMQSGILSLQEVLDCLGSPDHLVRFVNHYIAVCTQQRFTLRTVQQKVLHIPFQPSHGWGILAPPQPTIPAS